MSPKSFFKKFGYLLLNLTIIGSLFVAFGQTPATANNNETRAVPPRPAWQGIGCESGVGVIRAYVGEVSGATYYRVYRIQNKQNQYQMFMGTTNTPVCDGDSCRYEFTDYTVDPYPDFYTYSFSACNSEGCSDKSSGAVGSECSISMYRAPENFQVSQNTYQDKVKITWDFLGSNPHYYQIFYMDIGEDWEELGTTNSGGQNYFMDYDAPQGQHRFYRVNACSINDHCGYLTDSDIGWRRLPPPSFVNATNGTRDGYVFISWEAISGATTYKLYRGTASGTFDPAWTKTISSIQSYTDNTVSGTTHYWYVVTACFSLGCSGYSADDEGWAGTPPPAPTGVNASATYEDKISVTWNTTANTTYYEVYRSDTSGGTYVKQTDKVYALGWDDYFVNPGIKFWYKVQACNLVEGSTCGALSTANSGERIGTLPKPPENVQASDGTYTNKVTITWSSVAGATSYKIFRSETNDSGSASQIGTTGGATTFDDTPAIKAKVYYYWVKSVNASGDSAFSKSDSGYVDGNPFPPSNVQASDGAYPDKVHITWDSAPAATSYRVLRSTTNNSGSASSLGVTANTYFEDTTASYGVTYYYWVKSRKSTDEFGYSDADTGYRRGLAPPINFHASKGTILAGVRMSWNAVATAENYHIYRNLVYNASTATLIASTSNTFFDDLTADEDTLYYYWVTSSNASFGEGGFGTPEKGYWNGLGAPTGVQASDAAYTDKVRITWVAADNAHGYKVFRSTMGTPVSSTEIGTTNSTQFDDTTAIQDVYYYYWVKSTHNDPIVADSSHSAPDIGFSSATVIGTLNIFLPLILR